MRGKPLTAEEMRNPTVLFEERRSTGITDYGENYAILIYPSEPQRKAVERELETRVGKWGMTVTHIQTDDYLTALIALSKQLYADIHKGKQPHHNLVIECRFEDEYMDWLENGMTPEELVDYCECLNWFTKVVLNFVHLEEYETTEDWEDPKTGRFYSRPIKEIRGIVDLMETIPHIYSSLEEKRYLNKGGIRPR